MGQYEFREMLLSPGVKGRPGQEISPKSLVIHWTANVKPGADAVANRNYFNNSGLAVSAHYIVDDNQIVQCLPETEMAYHVGSKGYKPAALQQLSSYPNNCTIGIEMCVNQDGNFQQTYKNTVALAAEILKRYGWGMDKLWRHYDVTGKDCPKYFVDDGTARLYDFNSAAGGWERFKADVGIALLGGDKVSSKFIDLESHWAKKEIEEAEKAGLVSGKEDGIFDPNSPITRAESTVVDMRVYRILLAKIEALEKRIAEVEGGR